MFLCPVCGSRKVGKIGGDFKYFCSDCFIEFSNNAGIVHLYKIKENGEVQLRKESK